MNFSLIKYSRFSYTKNKEKQPKCTMSPDFPSSKIMKKICDSTYIYQLTYIVQFLSQLKRVISLNPSTKSHLFQITKGRTLNLGTYNSVRNHALRLSHKAISSPIFVRLQTLPDRFPLLNCFLLPSYQISVSCKILKGSPGEPSKAPRRKKEYNSSYQKFLIILAY